MSNQSFLSSFRRWFNKFQIQDPVDRKSAALLQGLLLGLLIIIGLACILNLFLAPDPNIWPQLLLQGVISIFVISVPLVLLRRGNFHGSVLAVAAVLLIAESFTILVVGLYEVADTLFFFTLSMILSGLLIGRKALTITFGLSVVVVFFGIFREQDAALRTENLVTGINFVLLNGLIGLFIGNFSLALRSALRAALQREDELKQEIQTRKQAQAALQHSTTKLETLHEIDRSLLTARTHQEVARTALARIRKLIPCPRASVSLLNTRRQEASFLAMDSETHQTMPTTPISFAEFGQQTIDDLLQNKASLIDDSLAGPNVTELDLRLARIGIRSWACLPLLSKGQLVGSLNLGRGAGETFTADEIEIARDIADQLAIAIQQMNLYNALQDELAARKQLIAELESSNAELERFTYTVSHDLRSPLVTIKGFLGILGMDIQNNRADKIQSDLQRIANAADKMDALLYDLLELSRIGRIINPPEEVQLDVLVKEAVESLDARLRSGAVTVDISPTLPVVYGDRVRLREVFENLIDNAAKYMGGQEHPLIEIGARNGEETVIYVKDNGLGIESKYAARIFGLFEKLNPSSEGTGIGLALIKRIIEVQGGKIWVESEGLGKGSTFCFTIPDTRT